MVDTNKIDIYLPSFLCWDAETQQEWDGMRVHEISAQYAAKKFAALRQKPGNQTIITQDKTGTMVRWDVHVQYNWTAKKSDNQNF